MILREILANWVLLPAIDALADPENINMLVTLSTHRDTSLSNSGNTVNVPMLQSWVTTMHSHTITNNCFKPSLNEVLSDPELLYMFMQHIKESGPMNLLQFCLDIGTYNSFDVILQISQITFIIYIVYCSLDDLSKRMLNPEMSSSAEKSLYIDVRNLYTVYLDPDGPEYLYLPLHISKGIRESA